MNILTLNVGSSSLKFGFYQVATNGPILVAEGNVDTGGTRHVLRFRECGQWQELTFEGDADAQALRGLLALPPIVVLGAPAAVAHRIVHGGPSVRRHCLIDDTVLAAIEAAASFAPLHVPPALAWVRHSRELLPESQQVACLDTAFHHPLPDMSRVLPLPHALQREGVERYGFHGLSCESILAQLPVIPPRVVIAHLGSGASLTAVRDGRSVDTSMGMTPTGGIIMGTRPGDIDPGVMLFLLREKRCDAEQLQDLLEHRSGLLGISDLSADVRKLAEATGQPLAELALEQFAMSVARQAAGMAVVLGGLNLLVFTGGIGEHHAPTRERVIALLQPLLPSLQTRVLPSRENLMMARHAARLVASAPTAQK
ncbi:acetate kinase [Dyella jiangningensis]|nr:acetate kinase [Dyella jiangningensis]